MANPSRSVNVGRLQELLASCKTDVALHLHKYATSRIHLSPLSALAVGSRKWGPELTDIPTVQGPLRLSWDRLPTVIELRDALLEAIGEAEDLVVRPTTKSANRDRESAIELVNNVHEPNYRTDKGMSILGLPCSTMDQWLADSVSDLHFGSLQKLKANEEAVLKDQRGMGQVLHRLIHDDDKDVQAKKKNTARSVKSLTVDEFLRDKWVSMISNTGYQCDIMSSSTLDQRQYVDQHEVSLLIKGQKVWFLYPPTDHNMDTVGYQMNLHQHVTKKQPLRPPVMRCLEGGVMYLQAPGETLTIPPFCMRICFSATASVSARYFVSIASQIPQRIMQLPLLRAENPSMIQSTTSTYLHTLLNDIEKVFNGEVQNYDLLNDRMYSLDPSTMIQWLVPIWEHARWILHRKALRTGDKTFGEDFMSLWANALLLSEDFTGSESPSDRCVVDCSLCDKTFEWKAEIRIERRQAQVRDHLVENHWEEDD